MSLPKKLALIGGLVGIALAVALAIASVMRRGPGGPGENLMWLHTYAAILGAPLSILADAVQLQIGPVAVRSFIVLAAIPVNWAAVGYALGWLIDLFGRRGT